MQARDAAKPPTTYRTAHLVLNKNVFHVSVVLRVRNPEREGKCHSESSGRSEVLACNSILGEILLRHPLCHRWRRRLAGSQQEEGMSLGAWQEGGGIKRCISLTTLSCLIIDY